MAKWHLDELRSALERRGWRFQDEEPGDDYRISATWRFVRSGSNGLLLIEFDGLDDLQTLPINENYVCRARGSNHALYLRRSRSRKRWRQELAAFAAPLNEINLGS
jgi:hypothetical protein